MKATRLFKMGSVAGDRVSLVSLLSAVGLLLIAVVLAGCSAPPVHPGLKWLHYEEPEVSREPVAFLFGNGAPGEVLTPIRAFVFAVDDKRVYNGADRWQVPIPLKPGTRLITVEVNRGSAYARVNLSLNAEAGRDYSIQFSSDLGRANSFCDFWIMDRITRAPVTKVQRGNVIR